MSFASDVWTSTREHTERAVVRWFDWGCVATVLVSAFLLFQVQPLVSKAILPWFGGSPAVWTTCMLFFQTLLFAGYAYAHWSENRLPRSARLTVHLGLLLMAVFLLPIVPDVSWKPTGQDNPTWRILALLSVSVGVPYFVLSSTGPLVQSWFSRTFPGRSPYRLYAVSNAGSLAALLSYPFLVEPTLRLGEQAAIWSGGFLVFAMLAAASAMVVARAGGASQSVIDDAHDAVEAPNWRQRLLWVALPGFASMMLLATTNHVCQDVAVIPFLWVVPLSLYLLSFIICFDHERWYSRRWFAGSTAVLLVLVAGLYDLPFDVTFRQELLVSFLALFGVCMVCHGELVRLKPSPKYLTAFYLWIAAGGALGGLFVSLVAPLAFDDFFEWKIGIVGGYVLAVILLARTVIVARGERSGSAWNWGWRAAAASGPAMVGLGAIVVFQAGSGTVPIVQSRNFYGEITVLDRAPDDPEQHDRALLSGGIVHGVQFVAAEKRQWPTTYYAERSGVGKVLTALREGPPLRVGAIGLGVGTLATYARPGDMYRFYEINPEIIRVAYSEFDFLDASRGETEIVLGDARLSLEREPPQRFDVLVLDAFSGDSVPAHLLTEEACEVYLSHLAGDGVICVHITNTYLNLAPVIRGLAERFNLHFARVKSEGDYDRALYSADWMILSRDASRLEQLLTQSPVTKSGPAELWTDDYSNLFRILK